MSKPTIPLTPGCYFHIYNRGINSCPIFHDDADHERFLYLYRKYVSQIADTLAWVLMRTHIHFLLRVKEDVVYRYSMEEIRGMEAKRANAGRSGNPANAGRSDHPARPSRDATGFSLPNSIGFADSRAGREHPADAISFAKWETVNISSAGWQDSGTSAGRQDSAASVRWSRGEQGPVDVSGKVLKAPKTPNPSTHIGHLFNAYARYFNLKYHRHGSLFEHQFKRKPVEDERYLRNVVVYIHKNPEHHGYYADFRHYPWSSYQEGLSGEPGLIDRDEVFGWFGDKGNFILSHNHLMNMDQLDEWLDEE